MFITVRYLGKHRNAFGQVYAHTFFVDAHHDGVKFHGYVRETVRHAVRRVHVGRNVAEFLRPMEVGMALPGDEDELRRNLIGIDPVVQHELAPRAQVHGGNAFEGALRLVAAKLTAILAHPLEVADLGEDAGEVRFNALFNHRKVFADCSNRITQ